MKEKVIFNVLAKDLENAKEIAEIGGDRVLIGVMMKGFESEEAAIAHVQAYQENGVHVSVGLGAGDPSMWKMVANVSSITKPKHINQVFPAAGYTLGRMEQVDSKNTIVNALIEPSGEVGKVIISTGPSSYEKREKVSCDMAASMLSEIGVHSVKFYPIDAVNRLDEVAAMVRAAVDAGINVFEPTGGIDMENVQVIVETCLENGAELVIPHLYTSLVDKDSGKTEVEKVKRLLNMEWN
ncbi:KDGP aldolase [Gottfriedia luciferensis]|uniref:KDGP aldolase n=1 Tax=Gottfriedia luciferensis TaxID=178774 RepID=UPI000B441115|nr:KDGP aldolase [Gottfriedia luciferensis]